MSSRYVIATYLIKPMLIRSQRLAAGRMIRSLLRPDDYVIVVEHDLAVLDVRGII
jgi:translation initiation factor RLI1